MTTQFNHIGHDEEKATYPRPIWTEHKKTVNNRSLDAMAKEAHHRGISYGKLQGEETIDRIRAADRARTTLTRWGRGDFI